MAKPDKKFPVSSESEACEILELSIEQIELLTRAFRVIDEVCSERAEVSADHESVEQEGYEEILLH